MASFGDGKSLPLEMSEPVGPDEATDAAHRMRLTVCRLTGISAPAVQKFNFCGKTCMITNIIKMNI